MQWQSVRNARIKKSGLAGSTGQWKWFDQCDIIFNRGNDRINGACETGVEKPVWEDNNIP